MNDALARLRNRQRPTVPNRDASLTSSSEDISTSGNQELENLGSPMPEQGEINQEKELGQPIKPKPQTPLKPESSNSRHPEVEIPKPVDIEEFCTKQSTLRLEAGLSDRLQSLCRSEGICREVLLEALFEYFETHSDSQPEVLSSAQTKNEHRQQLANLKRAQSMMKRFGGGN